MKIVEQYLQDLKSIHDSDVGTDEMTYYNPLLNLLNAVGRTLKPKVKAVGNLADVGAGHPDVGLFSATQAAGQIPERGVVEVKGTAADVMQEAQGEQVAKYLMVYRQVLVTNYWNFILMDREGGSKPVMLESYRLAEDESDFWQKAAQPHKLSQAQGEPFLEYLKRVMLRPAFLSRPQDVAWFLASYARDALARIADDTLPGLTTIRTTMEESLGLTFESKKGDQFFRSTLIQTLFYGVFSAWVLWHKENPTRIDRFDWRVSAFLLRVPIIQVLFEQLSVPSKLKALGLVKVLDLVGNVLNRVDRSEFFAHFSEGEAVQYFYEPFLEAFSPKLRKDLGVWYTPPEVVTYMVERVDMVLREELSLEDGLANENVYVLDPCCGTGAYLLAVLKKIADTYETKGMDALSGAYVKKAATERVLGFEILPAPFVIAHLQLGLFLQNLNAPFDQNERAGVYLTNALTGWNLSPDEAEKNMLPFPEFEKERDAAEAVKQAKPILVVLGNPPYNAFAGVSPKEEQGLVKPYKEGLIEEWGIKKFNLDDLYVRFFRLAEHRIAEVTGKGVVCYISNFSYLSEPSFVVMRQRFLAQFDKLWFDCLNGDSRETGKRTPDGKPDPSIFSTKYNSSGIRVGTAIGLMVRTGNGSEEPTVRFRHFWGVTKRADLLKSLKAKMFDGQYEISKPQRTNRFSFRPTETDNHYLEWPKLVELCANPPINGLMEKRSGALFDIDRNALEKRMRMYYNRKAVWEELEELNSGLTKDAAGFDAKKVRAKVQVAEYYQPSRIRRYALRSFDTRWCYYSNVSPLWNRSRPALWAQCWEGNTFLLTRPAGVAKPEGVPIFFTPLLGDNDFLRGHAYYFPLRLRDESQENNKQAVLFHEAKTTTRANLSPEARVYLASLGITNPDADTETTELLWMHALAIGYSPIYLDENADGIRIGWPRIPLPNDKDLLIASSALGRQVAALLDTESGVAGVTAGGICPELRVIALVTRRGGGQLNPAAGDLALSGSWGYLQGGYITMPGPGTSAERDYTPDELNAIETGARALDLTLAQALDLLGATTYDIYLNDIAYWRNVPANVWTYIIGGYQVIKKWLSYREKAVLGRDLKPEEVMEVTNIERRIAAIILLQPKLDNNYQAVKSSPYDWPQRR